MTKLATAPPGIEPTIRPKQKQRPIAIIGGGLAGLTAADYLDRNGVPFILFESGEKIAGLARSFKDEEGFSHDFGAHFLTNRLADAIGVGSECITVKHYGEAVWIDGKCRSYPFGLAKLPRMVASFIKRKISAVGRAQTPASAAEWFQNSYGEALANEVALPLIQAWSGASADELSPEVGESLPGSIAKTLWLKVAAKLTGRAVACGYNREKPEGAGVYHVYPKGGIAVICEKLAEGLGDRIKLQSPVEAITVANDLVTTVRAAGVTYEVAAVISTAPAPILPRLVQGTDILQRFADFRYRPMTFVNMRFEGRKLLPDTVVWVPQEDSPFFRLTEAPISMPWLAPEGKTIITADIGCQRDDEFWTMDDATIAERCLEHAESIIPGIRDRYLGCSVLRTPIAYPVFLNSYEQARQDFAHSTGVENLISVGRNGEFSHIFMEDVYWRTLEKTGELVRHLKQQS
ncbi:MAG: oxygen-dependent protoporphyrinogen oxidase [Verrucomicrobiales bacterium]|jgi:oxygen-dependent protoporphyrinogen oxidase